MSVVMGWCRPVVPAGLMVLLLAACGGGGPGSTGTEEAASTDRERALAVVSASPTAAALPTTVEARRFLVQSTFGPNDTDTNRVKAIGYEAWIDEQIARTARSVRTYVESEIALDLAAGSTDDDGNQIDVVNGVWKQALTDPAQLRQRMAYTLAQIFVVSLVDPAVHHTPRSPADFYDMLARESFGNYRTLLEKIAKHPVMARYLTAMANRKADPETGRVPDENFAREVMQLFSIGLYQLNTDGSRKLVNGKPVETYGPADVAGLAKVFTGWSWSCLDFNERCFSSWSGDGHGGANLTFTPLLGYPQWHSTEEKKFIGVTIPAQSTANPEASLKAALDALFKHPNVGPFIGRQLIQRLVTSNPSPAYVAAVAAAFNDNGAGVRGDMKAVVKAVLLHPEARAISPTGGKVREPLLRNTAFLRAFPVTSFTGRWLMNNTDDPAVQLGQTPLRSPSVFNFFRPGYVAPNTGAAAQGLVAPEMQIVDETTVAGYVNHMRNGIMADSFGSTSTDKKRDVRFDFKTEINLSTNAGALADRLNERLLYGTMPAAMRSEIVTAVNSYAIPALLADGSNQAKVDAAKRNRAMAALLMTVASPEYVVQK